MDFDSDDLLSEILVRLPWASLRSASLVCRRWRRLITDSQFLRHFYAHHGEPPVVGVFLKCSLTKLTFRSILDPPYFIPPERFSLPLDGIKGGREEDGIWSFRCCRHGRVLFINGSHSILGCRKVLVWDPVTGDRRCIGSPQHLNHGDWSKSHVRGDVLCFAGEKGHVHGRCHTSPFKVVLVRFDDDVARACVYSSDTGVWGDLISIVVQDNTVSCVGSRSVSIGNSLYWFLFGAPTAILELDLDRQSLAVIEVPWYALDDHHGLYLSTLGGALGFIVMSKDFRAQLWERTTNVDGVAGWMPGQTIELYKLLPLKSEEQIVTVLGIAGDANVIFVATLSSVFMVHIESLQFKKIFLTKGPEFKKMINSSAAPGCPFSCIYPYPFTSFCAAALGNLLEVRRQSEGGVGGPTH